MFSGLQVARVRTVFGPACVLAIAACRDTPEALDLPVAEPPEGMPVLAAERVIKPAVVRLPYHFDDRLAWRETKWADEDGTPLGSVRPCAQEKLDAVFAARGAVQRLRSRWWVLRPAIPFLEDGEPPDHTPEVYSDGRLRVTLVQFPISRGYGGTDATRAWGYVDRDGEVVIPPVFQYASTFSEGLAAVQPLGASCVGFIDTTGAWAIPCSDRFSTPAYFSEGLAATGGRYIDPSGTVVLSFEGPDAPDYLGAFRRGRAVASNGSAEGYVDRHGTFDASPTDNPAFFPSPDDVPSFGWPTKIMDAYRTGLSEGRRVRGDQCTFEVTDESGNLIFDHILLDPAWLLLSENWSWQLPPRPWGPG
jgi:hypothetical protein